MATTAIPAFAATTLLLGGFNELSIQLTLVGILSITLHALITPTDLPGLYPNFDNYTPTQPPLRDYVLVFGLASLVLVSLFSRIHPLLLSLACATWKALRVCLWSCGSVARQARPMISRILDFLGRLGRSALKLWDTIADYDFLPIPHIPQPHHLPSSPSPSHTSTDQWAATTSTLTVESPAPPTTRATDRGVTDPSETAALKLRVSQLEVALEELKRRVDASTTGEQGMDATSSTAMAITTKPPPIHTPPPSLNPDIALPSTTQPQSTSPLPTDEDSTPHAALGSVDTPINGWEKLRSLVDLMTEETRQTDRLISNLRNLVIETDGTTFEAHNDTDNTPPAPPTSGSTRSLFGKRLPPPSTATPISPSPYPSPSPSPSARLDRPLWATAIRRTRNTSPPPSVVNQIGKTAKGFLGIPKYNVTRDFWDLSGAPRSTPLRSAWEVEQTTASPPSFLGVLESDFRPHGLPATRVSKPSEDAGMKVHPASRATARLARLTPPTSARHLLARLRERSVKSPYPPPSRAVTESPLGPREERGLTKATKLLEDMSDWIADRRRKRKVPPDSRPTYWNRRE